MNDIKWQVEQERRKYRNGFFTEYEVVDWLGNTMGLFDDLKSAAEFRKDNPGSNVAELSTEYSSGRCVVLQARRLQIEEVVKAVLP